MTAAQQTTAALTDVYLSQALSEMSGSPVTPVGIPAEMVTGSALRNGVTPDVEYTRPIKEVWYQLSEGRAPVDAQAIGQQRALTMISTDLQLARTHASRIVLQRSGPSLGVVGYRRVVGSGRSCELCQIAATQRYHIADLMPIHANCSCAVAPITGSKDPGQVIDAAYLAEDAKASDVSGKFSPYYGAHLLEVREHGELGPVLTVRGQGFRGPADIPPAAETAA
ncbi:hypothetical protein E6W39_18920 [Kitasatospora acidiphila]|uniref:Capsid maturation protease n=1 Tax=Kitasatospora acidiphila TaxID=2567942 RepID=A0A540W6E4_9ACTN|nr:hypothetical protein [Kitasatospora acidiphila]TQF03924.1 hypothetical protein E6W39_18920 [Kitasatospora acidiphila]